MTNLNIIKFADLKINSVCNVFFGKEFCAKTTSTTSTLMTPGIYDNGGSPFKNLDWFADNDFRMCKNHKKYLLYVLTRENIITITVV